MGKQMNGNTAPPGKKGAVARNGIISGVEIVHDAVRGRARLRVPGLYRCDALKVHLESRLSREDAITFCSASSSTGTILLRFPEESAVPRISSLVMACVAEFSPMGGSNPAGCAVSAPSRDSGTSVRPGKEDRLRRRKLRLQVVRAEEQAVDAWHLLEGDEILSRFAVSQADGLSPEFAARNLRKYGPNLLPESVPRSGFSIFIDQFRSLPVYLLGVSAALSVVTGGAADAVAILAVVGINAVIGYVTESKAEMTIHSLKRLVRPSAHVIRGGMVREVRAEEVAPGDIIALKPGSYIIADSRIVESNHLSIDESALTGESLPVTKMSQALLKRDLPLADRTNMAYMGTLVTGGQGAAVVVGTGKYTELGKVQELVGEARPPKTPMENQLDSIGTRLVYLSAGVCGLVFVAGMVRGYGFLQMLRSSVSLAVAAIPEGLPAVATTILALGIRDMKKHKVLIRRLDAVETLGAVQTICLDKTGTLTQNRMAVVAVHAGMRHLAVADGLVTESGRRVDPLSSGELIRLLHVCVLCSETGIDLKEGEYLLNGSSTENALVHLAITAGVDVFEIRRACPLVRVVHRSEARNYMLTLHGPLTGHVFPSASVRTEPRGLIALKGSPLEVLSMCDYVVRAGMELPLTEEERFAIELANERMAGESLRVLGLACAIVGTEENGSPREHGFVWLGLVGMADPVRPGVKELMGVFHRAGVDTLMITGDQVPTAYAVGRELSLSNGGPLEIFDSTNLQEMEPELLNIFTRKVHVFARVSPAQKLQIVQALQRGGRVVAMTGDGINDSPALKAADIGIAMGGTGTDVAREVADVVLEDDRLETMIIAISHGRTVYDNIRKSVRYLLSTNLTEIMVMFSAIVLGMGQPFTTMQLLWINLISDIFPGLALALEKPEQDVLQRPPRDPAESIISNADLRSIGREGAVISAFALGAYGWGLLRYGAGPKAGAIAFLGLTGAQLQHAVYCRSEVSGIFGGRPLPPNPYLKWALSGSFALQALVMVVPGTRGLLGIVPLALSDYLVIGGSAVAPFIVNEAVKHARSGEPS